MKRSELLRLIGIPVAFIAVVVFAFVMSPNTRYVSEADLLSVQIASKAGESATLDTPEGIHAFVLWLERTVPADELCFVKENERYLSETADWSITVDQVPDQMKGLDTAETFAYSIYHMYVYVENGALYYNGVLYDFPEAAKNALPDLLKE